jgi:general secretion pathway protein K
VAAIERRPIPMLNDLLARMGTAKQKHPSKSGDDGFIIVAVLWILAALATLVSIYAIYVTNSAIAVSASSDAILADPLVTAGVELAAYQLIGVQKDKRPTVGNFTARVGTARLAVAFQTEAARIDLNAASKELLTGLFVGLGAMPLDAEGYADRIIAWRSKTPVQPVDTNPENSLYRSVGLSYTPRHAPFVHISELWLVYGIPPAFVDRMLPYVTVFSGQGQVDVMDAAPQVIAALPNMTPQVLQSILAARQAGTLDDATLAELMAGTGQGAGGKQTGSAFRIGVRIDYENGRHSAAEAVILLPDDGPVPYRVLSWRNAMDGATDQAMDFGGR